MEEKIMEQVLKEAYKTFVTQERLHWIIGIGATVMVSLASLISSLITKAMVMNMKTAILEHHTAEIKANNVSQNELKKEMSEIKDNYLNRFDEIKNILNTMNSNIISIQKDIEYLKKNT